MAVPVLLRGALRRHAPTLRSRAQQAQRRAQSTKNDTDHATSKTPPAEEQIPVANNVPTLPFWQRLGPLTRAAEAYARAQRKRPLTTQLCSSMVIFFAGDIAAQNMGGRDYDPLRTGRAVLIGAISSIPSYKWFMFLSHNFNYASHVLSIATKVTVNQICFTPIFNSYFFGMQALLAGETLEETWIRIKKTVPISMMNSVKLWPAVTAFSFTFVPMEFRSVFAGVIAVGWQAYLSFLNRQAEDEERAAKLLDAVQPVVGKLEAA
ncbi:Mpv17/PMP22 family protein [Thozetella sp. PMI_491]|nr:Mpv17/PMP22 family protein [Thozetella sp. PMI_491]